MDNNLQGSIIDLIIAEGDLASGYFGGHFSQVAS